MNSFNSFTITATLNKLSRCVCVRVCVLLLYIIFTAVCKRGVCKHQLSFHDQGFQQTVFCRPLFVPRKQQSERQQKKYTVCTSATNDLVKRNRKQRPSHHNKGEKQPFLIRIYMAAPDSLHFWAKLLGDKGSAGDRWASDVQGSAHWQTRLLYPNPVDGCTGVISKMTMWKVCFNL